MSDVLSAQHGSALSLDGEERLKIIVKLPFQHPGPVPNREVVSSIIHSQVIPGEMQVTLASLFDTALRFGLRHQVIPNGVMTAVTVTFNNLKQKLLLNAKSTKKKTQQKNY